VLFCMRTAGTIWLIFFNVRNNPNEVLCKEKLGKLPGKLENSGKTAKIIIFVCTLDHT
jgi:hypothetical protein